MLDLSQARQLIAALTGSDASVVTFQAFYDPKDGTKRPDLAKVWHSTLDLSVDYINWAQSQNCGIYVCINGTDGKGREIYNINDLRVMFADFDGITEPRWVVEPHLVQRRDETHGHAFWLIEAGDITHDEWSRLQKQMAMFYGTDEQVIDPCRVVRLPGTAHLKNPLAPATYSVIKNTSATVGKYTPEQLRIAHLLPADKDAELNRWFDARKGIDTGVGYENNPLERNKFINFISVAAHPAALGSGTHELYRVACYGHDHGISMSEAGELLWEHYNPRCLPPWNDDEKDHFLGVVYRAYHYSVSAPGCKTARAEFQALPPMPEPSCGWDNQAAQFKTDPVTITEMVVKPKVTVGEVKRADHRISQEDSIIRAAQLTPKSSHYDFAVVFDGANYDGVSLIRSQKQFYRFNGRSWGTVDDDVIKSEVQRSFGVFKPTDAMTSGVFRVLCDLVTVDHMIEDGTWIDGRHSNTSNLVVFKNGIVDLAANNPEIIPHTHEFFALTELDYDFTPGATCPEWHKFLKSIWGDHPDLIFQLQEFFGYCLTPDTSLQKFAVFTGKAGGGKGTITRTLQNIVGVGNITSPALSDLHTNTAKEGMSGCKVILVPDARDVDGPNRKSVLSVMLAITGEDHIGWHRMYKGPINQLIKAKLALSANGMPHFEDSSGALIRRMLVFPILKSFYGHEDTSLKDKLEAETAGITQWAIQGLKRLRMNQGRFTVPHIAQLELDDLKRDMFPLSHYVETSCELTDANTLVDDLYNGYRLWAATEGVKMPMTKSQFARCLRNCSLPIHYVGGTRPAFNGIAVKDQYTASNVVGFRPIN